MGNILISCDRGAFNNKALDRKGDKLKTFALLVFLLLFFTTDNLFAGLGDKIEQAFEGAYVQSEGVMKFESQTRGYYTFGHARVRWETPAVIRPFSASAPSYNVGCNGIDISMGGFSYIQGAELVNKLKSMSGAASAFFFEAALGTLCKDCLTILNKLEDFANAINNLNFDSCAAAKAVGTEFGRRFGEKMKSGLDSFEATEDILKFPDLLENMDAVNSALAGIDLNKVFICIAIDGTSDCSGGAKYALVNRQGSLLRLALASQTMLGVVPNNAGDHEKFASVLRSLTGDLYGYTEVGKKNEKDRIPLLMYVAPSGTAPEVFINALMYGTDDCADEKTKNYQNCITGIVYDPEYDYSSDKPAQKPAVHVGMWNDFIPSGGLIGLTRNRLDAILNKIDGGEVLSEADQAFLGNLPYPIVKAINAKKAGIFNDSDMQIIVAYIAVRLAASTATNLLDKVHRSADDVAGKWIKGKDKDDDDQIKSFKQQVSQTARNVVRAFDKPIAEIDKMMVSIVDKAKMHDEIQKALMKQFYVGNSYSGGFGY
jgi:conjugative transfer pilus assembly protein TraH